MRAPQPGAGQTTPWGRADAVLQLAPGARWVSTPSHGGLILAPTVALALSDYALGIGEPCAGQYAYEEDCAYSAVFAERPDLADRLEEDNAKSSCAQLRYDAEAMLSKNPDDIRSHYAAIRDRWFGGRRAKLESLGRLRRALPGLRPGMVITLAGPHTRRYTVARAPRPILAYDDTGRLWRIPPSWIVAVTL